MMARKCFPGAAIAGTFAEMIRRAIYLDRDGTLVRDTNYLKEPDEVELLPGVREGLDLLRTLGCTLFMLTNQSGVGRGYFGMDAVEACNERMFALLDLPPDIFTGICIAPEHPDEPSRYRKPSPRYIEETRAEYGFAPDECWMVGDRASDIQTGLNAGVNVAALRTGDTAILDKLLPLVKEHQVPIFDGLHDFAKSLQRAAV